MRFIVTRGKATAAIATFYFASLAAPALYTAIIYRGYSVHPLPAWYGVEILLIGWTHMLAPGGFAWLGNPILLVGLHLFIQRSTYSLWVSFVGLAVALASYALKGVFADRDTAEIVGFGIGFYLWLASFVLLLAANLWFRRSRFGRVNG